MTAAGTSAPLLSVTALEVRYPIRGGPLGRVVGHIRAVEDVSLTIRPGETFGLVGESGSGKTTAGLAILQLIRPTAGRVSFDGEELTQLRGEPLRQTRRRMQIIFQDPFSSLDPKMTVGESVGESLLVHDVAKGAALATRVGELLEIVGLRREHATRYPHEFSGGQRQRLVIARALALRPELIVCDEPVSALDVSVQSQILNLLNDLQREFGLAYLFISHDLSVVKNVCDRVAVMYLGRIVETADTDQIVRAPEAPLYRGAHERDPRARPRRAASSPARDPRGRAAEPGRSARRLRVPPTVSAHRSPLHADPPRARGAAAGPLVRLPPPRWLAGSPESR